MIKQVEVKIFSGPTPHQEYIRSLIHHKIKSDAAAIRDTILVKKSIDARGNRLFTSLGMMYISTNLTRHRHRI
ncbi:MAG: hypothetical protein IPL08_18015 [Saprospiraceae bacterium]|nr:hypothetical protein [Saprospiraceae bacterium]